MEKEKKTKKDEFKVEIVDKFGEGELFDDCPVCQAMRLAQEQGRTLIPNELYEAMKKAKEKGAIVGGEWFEKSKDSKK